MGFTNESVGQRFHFRLEFALTIAIIFLFHHQLNALQVIPSTYKNVRLVTDTINLIPGDTATARAYLLPPPGSTVNGPCDSIRWKPLYDWSPLRLLDTAGCSLRITCSKGIERPYVLRLATGTMGVDAVPDTLIVRIIPDQRPYLALSIERCDYSPLDTVFVTSLWEAKPVENFYVNICEYKTCYAYAVMRDRYGNFVRFADSAVWTSLSPNTFSVQATPGKQFEGKILCKVTYGQCAIVATEPGPNRKPDTLMVATLSSETCNVRLFDRSTGRMIDTLRLAPNDSIDLRIKFWSHDFSRWFGCMQPWSLQSDSLRFRIPIPTVEDSCWKCIPLSTGSGNLVIGRGFYRDTIPVIVRDKTDLLNRLCKPVGKQPSWTIAARNSCLTIYPQSPEPYSVCLFSLSGRLLRSCTAQGRYGTINIPKGISIVKISDRTGRRSLQQKIIN
jgi:hypothetical protein